MHNSYYNNIQGVSVRISGKRAIAESGCPIVPNTAFCALGMEWPLHIFSFKKISCFEIFMCFCACVKNCDDFFPKIFLFYQGHFQDTWTKLAPLVIEREKPFCLSLDVPVTDNKHNRANHSRCYYRSVLWFERGLPIVKRQHEVSSSIHTKSHLDESQNTFSSHLWQWHPWTAAF